MNPVWPAIVAALSALAGVFLNQWITSRREISAKIWEMKLEVYGTVLNALREAEFVVEDMVAAASGPEPIYAPAGVESWDKQMDLARRTMIGREIILPEIFVEAYFAFAKELSSHDDNDDWRPLVEIVQRHRAILRTLARADINARRRTFSL